MDNLQTAPEELIQTLDPAPEAPDPIRMPRETWLQLIHTGHAEDQSHAWIWAAEGVYRIAKVWIGHPAIADHWQLIISFGGDTNGR